MPEQDSTITRWDNFSGGDYGNLSADKAPANTFKAKNMVVCSDGAICVRPGLKNITPASMPNGPLLALAANPAVGHDGVFMIAEEVYTFDLNTPATSPTHIGDFDQAPMQPIVPLLDTATLLVPNIYGSSPGTSDKVYRIDPAAGTVGGISGSEGGDVIALYGQQIVVGKSEFSPQIDASDPNDPTNWTAGIFADIGDNWQVTAMFTLRNVLAILKRTGLYVLSGVIGDPETQVIRDIESAPDGPLHAWHAAKDVRDIIWFWPLFDFGPASFNGSSYNYFGQYAQPERENDDTIADTPLKRGVVAVKNTRSNDPSTVIFLQGGSSNNALVRQNGVWTFHEFETSVSGLAASNGNQAVLTDGGTNVTPAQVFSWYLDINRPGFISDDLYGVGDSSDTPLDAWFKPIQYWMPAGREVEVRQVVVDFTSYDTGTTETNHFDVDVSVLGRGRQAANATYSTTSSEQPAAFDQATSDSSTTGTRQRKSFEWSVPSGGGFEITIKNIRGCKFHAVTVLEGNRKPQPIA